MADYLDFYADDPATTVGLAYVEGVPDGRAFFERMRAVADRKPLVLVKGGATAGGQRAAASHTGSLATDDRVFDGMCRQAGITRAATIEEAFEAAATFATQPLPEGQPGRRHHHRRRLGRGHRRRHHPQSSLELPPLPDDLRAAIDDKLPPRWSRNNPVDLAGGETRDTIPEVLELIAAHPEVDAVIYLGLGIQSNQAGPDAAPAASTPTTASSGSSTTTSARTPASPMRPPRSPTATASRSSPPPSWRSPTRPTPGPAAVRASGRLCYASANRAVTALDHLWRRARHQQARAGA